LYAAAPVLNVYGPGGVGKSALLRAFARLARARERTVLALDGSDLAEGGAALLRAVGAVDAEALARRLSTSGELLLVDTFEQCPALASFLWRELLPRLADSARVVIAGRTPLWDPRQDQADQHRRVLPLPLAVFSAEESRAYLARRGITDFGLVEQIVASTRGQPLALSLAADLVGQFGQRDFARGGRGFAAAPEWRLAVRGLVERLLRDVDDPQLRELLQAAAVVRQFDEETLAALTGREPTGAAFDRLCRLSFVKPTEHGLTLHDDVRRLIAEDLRWRRRALHNRLRRRALAYYRERMQDAPARDRQWLLAERLYLWDNVFVQATLFGDDDPGGVWTEAGRVEEDAASFHAVTELYLDQCFPREQGIPPLDRSLLDAVLANYDALWRHPAIRRRIARTGDGAMVGVSLVLPVCQDTEPQLRSTYHTARVLELLWPPGPPGPGGRPGAASALPRHPHETDIFTLMGLAYVGPHAQAARAALVRDLLGLFALGGMYVWPISLDHLKRLAEACGFRPAGSPEFLTAQGQIYVLDLRSRGVEDWIDSLIGDADDDAPPATAAVQH
jgi:energy-coupling factor transporter ATP-binding protein EcfA2